MSAVSQDGVIGSLNFMGGWKEKWRGSSPTGPMYSELPGFLFSQWCIAFPRNTNYVEIIDCNGLLGKTENLIWGVSQFIKINLCPWFNQ